VFENPIKQGLFKTDVVPRLLAFDPFVAEDFLALGEEFFVEQGFRDEIGVFASRGAHVIGQFLEFCPRVNGFG
jgi:hypothetical protein